MDDHQGVGVDDRQHALAGVGDPDLVAVLRDRQPFDRSGAERRGQVDARYRPGVGDAERVHERVHLGLAVPRPGLRVQQIPDVQVVRPVAVQREEPLPLRVEDRLPAFTPHLLLGAFRHEDLHPRVLVRQVQRGELPGREVQDPDAIVVGVLRRQHVQHEQTRST